MGGCFSCKIYNGYVLDWEDDDEVDLPDVQVTQNSILYHGKESRSLEKMVERGILELDTYLLFKNTSIQELGIVRRMNGKACIEYGGEYISLLQFCKRAAEKHGKDYTGTPWNSVWTIDLEDQPLERIGRLWDAHKKVECDEMKED